MRVKVDLAKCEGHGRCFEMSSDVFKRGDNGKCVVVVADVDRDNFDLLLQAEQAEMMCPAGAVTVE
jgi:ferredoxin